MDFTVARTLSSLYIALDILWLCIIAVFLIAFKKRLAVIVGLLAGIVYFIADYGIFYKLLGTRQISGLFIHYLSQFTKKRTHRHSLAHAYRDRGTICMGAFIADKWHSPAFMAAPCYQFIN